MKRATSRPQARVLPSGSLARRLNELSASEAARLIAGGEISSEALIRDCLARIDAREANVRAWALLDPEHALREARERDRSPARGPLHGVPIGVKDIVDTADMPTQMGSPIYKGFRPPSDAACVALVRAAGAVILGKTVTAEFAGMTPGATSNPHDPSRTPGGSSSGSGAAVADFMVPAAFGTQTGGSVLRPASFCGIVGYKPTFGRFNRAGIKMAAESLDTIGLLARTIDDIELLDCVLTGRLIPPPPHERDSPPRIGICRTHLWPTALPETIEAIGDSAARLAVAGAQLREITLPEEFAGLTPARELINDYERARATAYEWYKHRDLLSERLRRCIQKGWETPHGEYVAALELAARCRARLDDVFATVDSLLVPCVPGEAPLGLESTGSPRFQELWTLLHVPTATLPTHRGPSGLPVGIQLVAPRYEETRLLETARWVWERLGGGQKR
jgi:amidase